MCCSFENTTVSIVFYTKIKLDKIPKRMKIAHNALLKSINIVRTYQIYKTNETYICKTNETLITKFYMISCYVVTNDLRK